MEVLNALIAEGDRRGVFRQLPQKIRCRTSIYADDLVILLSPDALDFVNIRRILDIFAGASGLLTNVDKCVITPIRCSPDQVEAVRQVFPCKVQEFPTTKYLGAPLAVSRISRNEEQRIVDNVAARIPAWKGRRELVRTTLSASPVHVSICCSISPWGIAEIDRRRRAFLWAGSDSVTGDDAKLPGPSFVLPGITVDWASPTSAFSASPCASGGSGCVALSQTPPRRRCLRLRSARSLPCSVHPCTWSAKFWTDAWLPGGAISLSAPSRRQLPRHEGQRRLGARPLGPGHHRRANGSRHRRVHSTLRRTGGPSATTTLR